MSTEVRLRYPIQIQKGQRMSEPQNGRGALFAGGLAAILASTCCLGPLVLVAPGLLRCLDRQPDGAGTLSTVVHRRGASGAVLRLEADLPARAGMQAGEVCAIPQVRATYKLIFWIVAVLVPVALGFPYVVPFFY